MRRILCFAIVLALLGTFCACQPTPEKEIVANKGDGVLEQRISEAQEQEKETRREQLSGQATPVPTFTPTPYAHPDKWELEMDLTNYFVYIAAEIEVPQTVYPVVRLSGSDFTEKGDILTTLMTRVMGSPTAKRQGIYCYEDYVAMMEDCARGVYDFDANTYRPYDKEEQEGADREMAEYAEALKTALHREEFDEDGTLITQVGTEYTYCGAEGKIWHVRIREDSFSISTAHDTARSEDWVQWTPDYPGGPTPPPFVITVTPEQAQAEAEKVLGDFPGMEWMLEKTEEAAIEINRFSPTDPVEWMSCGYLMTYTRKIGGTNFFNYKEGGSPSRVHMEEAAYAASLPFETLAVFVDENGVQSLEWENPMNIEEQVAGHVELLPFEQIQDNLVNLLKAGLSWADEHPPSHGKLNSSRIAWIKRAVLGYAYVQEKDNPGKYLAVPTWFFTYQVENEMNHDKPPGVIALNAVDGTRVSLW